MLGGSTENHRIPSSSTGPFRLFSVPGFQNRTNDIVYCPPIIRQSAKNADDSTAIVYFGGDVQDFPESMETNRDSRGYLKFNLENSAMLLREAFPNAHVVVVRPVRMEFKTFSCFDNFVRGNNAGVPDHTPMNNALRHLECLLQNVAQRLLAIPENEILNQSKRAAMSANTTTTNTSTTQQATTVNKSKIDENSDMDIDVVDGDSAVINKDDENDETNRNCNENNKTPQTIATITTTILTNSNTPLQTTTTVTVNATNAANTAQKNNIVPAATQQQSNNCKQDLHPLWWRENLNLDKAKLALIGFSKGCVVLNQFIYEFHYLKTLTPDDSSLMRLISRLTDIYWLDGGHGGQKNTWITSRSLLETLTRMGLNIHIHLTPYQVLDDRRPWIRKEEKQFTDLLKRLGASITRYLHYDNQTASLQTHFEVLQAFCQHVQSQNNPNSNANSNANMKLKQQTPPIQQQQQQQQPQQQAQPVVNTPIQKSLNMSMSNEQNLPPLQRCSARSSVNSNANANTNTNSYEHATGENMENELNK